MRGKTAACPAVVLALVAGCNTDFAWEMDQRARSLTTPIDAPAGVELPDIEIADAREIDLVEQVLTHRALYHKSLTRLGDYYKVHGYESKRGWASHELADLNRVKPYRYVLSGEIPSDRLVPRDSIPEADALYERGLALMSEGGHAVPALYRRNKMHEALSVFREMIETHPSSDKIDDVAFQCGEIHKEYFKGEERLAVRWYERAFTWNPETSNPARFSAAAVYDLRLHDRDRALELYRAAIEHEAWNRSNVSFAMRRIETLTAPREPVPLIPPEAADTFAPTTSSKSAPENE